MLIKWIKEWAQLFWKYRAVMYIAFIAGISIGNIILWIAGKLK